MLTFALGARRCSRSAPSAATRLCPWPRTGPGGRIIICEISPCMPSSPAATSPPALRRGHRGWSGRPLRPSPHCGPFDLVFIDADKASYPSTSRPSCPSWPPGLIAADNTLWSGRLLDPADASEDTVARRVHDALAIDPRVVVRATVRTGSLDPARR